MRILIIEDDELKHEHLDKFIRAQFDNPIVNWKKSYHSGLLEIIEIQYDLVLLDMSMHVYEKTAEEGGGSFETYAGRLILSEIDLNEVVTKVIVVTGYDVYGDGKTLATLKNELRNEFGAYYLDTVYFVSKEETWQREITRLIKNNF